MSLSNKNNEQWRELPNYPSQPHVIDVNPSDVAGVVNAMHSYVANVRTQLYRDAERAGILPALTTEDIFMGRKRKIIMSPSENDVPVPPAHVYSSADGTKHAVYVPAVITSRYLHIPESEKGKKNPEGVLTPIEILHLVELARLTSTDGLSRLEIFEHPSLLADPDKLAEQVSIDSLVLSR